MPKTKLETNTDNKIDQALDIQLDKRSWSPILLIIRFYQKYISPLFGQNCRFSPTCSQYMVDAITEHGHLKGAFLGSKRICKCHPWNEGGYDPVPKN